MNFKKNKAIVIFDGQKIRRIWDDEKEQWYFSVVDVVEVLTGSTIPRRYWSDLKIKLKNEGSEVYEKIVQLKVLAEDGKKRETDMSDTETMFRIIQSIPSPKAEPFKLWLARVGYERVEEAADPEKAIQRAMAMYLKLGYSKDWVDLRLKSIEIRKDLTNEWQERGILKNEDYAILTDDITLAWAGINTKDYKRHKNLKKENLRDNMTNLELVLSMLAETSTTEISKVKKPRGIPANRQTAREGGKIAGNARRSIEKQTGKPVISPKNAEDIRLVDKKKLS